MKERPAQQWLEERTISRAMKILRSRVKRNARTPEQLRNAIAARWPKGKASGQVRNGKIAKKT